MNLPKWPVSGDREIELLREVLASSQWGGFHEMVARFETQFAEFQHARHAISASNGTVTLEIALEAAGVGPGDEVIVPAHSFVATAMAVSRVGALPVFVDLEPYSFCIDPERVAEAITPRTRAIIAVHFGGPMADVDRLVEIAEDNKVALIEDAAHAEGSEWRGRRAGTFGVCGSFSFQNGKVMTAGEGGAITTNDDGFAGACRSIVNQGRCPGESFYRHFRVASNYRLTALQAAVLVAQLERLPEQSDTRRRNEALIKDALADLDGIRFQEVHRACNTHSHYLLTGRIHRKKRDEFHQKATAAGVPMTPFYPHTLYQNPVYRNGRCRVEPCPNAEAAVEDGFWLPHRALLGDESTTQEIAEALRTAAL